MDRRDSLLCAAEDLLAESGSRSLTLEAVARRAGVSKGGLLYHFATKNALITAMIGKAVEQFDDQVASGVRAGQSWMRSYLDACFADVPSQALGGVLAAAAEDPELLAPFREAVAKWYQRALVEAGARGQVVLLALDALWFHGLIRTLPDLDGVAIRQTLEELS